jgi:hypothetical protein
MSQLLRLPAKILTFAVFMIMESYSCEKGAFISDGWLLSLIRQGTLFSSNINMNYCDIQFTLTGCELNENLNAKVRQIPRRGCVNTTDIELGQLFSSKM